MAKMNNVEIAFDAARTARDIRGTVGILDSHQCCHHMCNLESFKTYDGTDDIHLLVLGQHITGLSAFVETSPRFLKLLSSSRAPLMA